MTSIHQLLCFMDVNTSTDGLFGSEDWEPNPAQPLKIKNIFKYYYIHLNIKDGHIPDLQSFSKTIWNQYSKYLFAPKMDLWQLNFFVL